MVPKKHLKVFKRYVRPYRKIFNGNLQGESKKMTSEKDLRLAYGLIVVCLVVGFFSYAFSANQQASKEPLRKLFTCVAGKVMFTHQTHADESGYEIACADCHHHPEEPEGDMATCGSCHDPAEDGSMPESCNECHEPEDYEGTEISKKSDALHTQCIGCHKENDAGPVECSACHVLVQ